MSIVCAKMNTDMDENNIQSSFLYIYNDSKFLAKGVGAVEPKEAIVTQAWVGGLRVGG